MKRALALILAVVSIILVCSTAVFAPPPPTPPPPPPPGGDPEPLPPPVPPPPPPPGLYFTVTPNDLDTISGTAGSNGVGTVEITVTGRDSGKVYTWEVTPVPQMNIILPGSNQVP